MHCLIFFRRTLTRRHESSLIKTVRTRHKEYTGHIVSDSDELQQAPGKLSILSTAKMATGGTCQRPLPSTKAGEFSSSKTVPREAPFYHEQRSHNRVTGSKYIMISSQFKVPLTFSLPRCLFHYVPTLYLFLFQPWRVASEGESDSRGKYGLSARFLQSARLQS